MMSHRFVRFCLVGGATACIHIGLALALVNILSLGPVIASSIGFVCAVAFNYVMQKTWSFDSNVPHRRALTLYTLVVVSGFAINAVVIYVGTSVLETPFLLSQAVAVVIIVTWNFVMFSKIVFRQQNLG